MGEYIADINRYLDYVFAYGPVWVYLAILAACFIENITPPFPGDSFIVAAGALVAVHRLEPVPSFLMVITGGMGSIMLIYVLGRVYGRDFFMRKNYKLFSAADIMAVEEKFRRYGGLMLIASRFVVGFRVALALAAGMGRFPALKMFVYTLISYMAFAALLMYGGFKLVENLDRIEYYFHTYNYIAWPIVILIVVVYVVRRIIKIRKRNSA
jgi:membrane protein DedA with SNARE-associated domain